MAKFKIKLVLFNDNKQVKYVTEEADSAIQATLKAAEHNPDYIDSESNIIEDEDTNTTVL